MPRERGRQANDELHSNNTRQYRLSPFFRFKSKISEALTNDSRDEIETILNFDVLNLTSFIVNKLYHIVQNNHVIYSHR